jgi:predicted metal-binding membrane protein
MMLPSAAPMILLFATINRKRRQEGSPYVRTGVFALGYVIVWAGFSIAATTLQWRLDGAMLLSPMMAATSVLLAGGVLIVAGIYQLTPLKQACLRHCRSPLDFILHHWRRGSVGALVMGVRHGLYCLGCCWVLMSLLFVGGVMNFLWIAAIAAYVLLEKTVPAGHWISRAAGVALVAWGGFTVASVL